MISTKSTIITREMTKNPILTSNLIEKKNDAIPPFFMFLFIFEVLTDLKALQVHLDFQFAFVFRLFRFL
jgi:hypothetical protein